MLKPFLLLTAVVSLAIAIPSASARPPQSASKAKKSAKAAAAAKSMARAKQIYKIDCALCHGATGNGQTDVAKDMGLIMPDWTNPATLAGKSDDVLFQTIRKGKDKMPPEAKGRAKDDEVHALINLIRTFAKDHPATAAAPAAPATPAAPASPPQQ